MKRVEFSAFKKTLAGTTVAERRCRSAHKIEVRMNVSRLVCLCVVAVGITTAPAFGAPFTADFSGQISPGSANVKVPFTSVLTQGGAVGGHFLYDSSLIPGPLSGSVNIFFSAIPDINAIPPATAFHLDLGGGLLFDLDDALAGSAAIRYNNGVFGGFFFVSDFLFEANPYRFRSEGATWNIRLLVNGNPSGGNLVNGSFKTGNQNLSNVAPYVPGEVGGGAPVPEPATLTLLGTGLFAALARSRRQRRLRS